MWIYNGVDIFDTFDKEIPLAWLNSKNGLLLEIAQTFVMKEEKPPAVFDSPCDEVEKSSGLQNVFSKGLLDVKAPSKLYNISVFDTVVV